MIATIGDALVVEVWREADAGRARRAATALAEALGFGLTPRMEVGIAVSELAHNLVWHTSGGSVTLRRISQGERIGVEVVCQDQGPGIADIQQAMQDGFSTTGSLGCGLPAVPRLMDEFSIESELERGTIIVTRKWL